MNERIRALAMLAGAQGIAKRDFVDTHEFAELIIRECLEQVRDEVQYEYDWKLADAVTKRVLQHFGVEE